MANQFTSAQAPSGMPSQAMQFVAPELAANQVSNARLQQLAQMLKEKGFAEDGGTQVINGWAVKKSPMEGLSKLASVLAGTYLQKHGDEKNAELQKTYAEKLKNLATGAPTAPPSVGLEGAPTDATGGASVAGSPGQPAQGGSGSAFSMDNLMRGQAIEMLGGDNAGKNFWADKATTDMEKQNRYLGIDQATAKQNALAEAVVKGTQNMRGGSTIRLPDNTMFTAPDQDSGVMTNWEGGKPSLSLIPGAQDVLSVKSQAAQEGKNRATPASTDLLTRNPDGTYAPKTVDQIINQTGAGTSAGLEPSGLPTKLIDNLIGIESGGNPKAVNPQSGAQGLGQFMPSTVKMLADQGYKFDPFDKVQARKAMGDYLSTLVDQNGGDVKKALAAYGGFKTKDPTDYVNRAMKDVSFGQGKQGSATPAAQGAGVPFGMEDSVKGNVKLSNDTYTTLASTNSNAPQLISALDNVSKYAKGAITGGLSEQRQLTNSITSLVPGWSSELDAKTQTDLFNKAASRLVLAGTSSAAATDALRILAQAASPNSKMTEPAIQEATSEIKSIVQMNLDNQQILQQDKAGNNFNGVNQKHLDFNTNADPLLWRLKNMPSAERKEYWAKLPPAKQEELLKKGRAIQGMGGLK